MTVFLRRAYDTSIIEVRDSFQRIRELPPCVSRGLRTSRYLLCVLFILCLTASDVFAVRLSPNPNPIVFAGTKVGFSIDQYCVVTNLAPVNIQVDGAQIAGGPALDFILISPTAFPFVIAAHDSARFLIRFRPTQSGARQSFLQISSSDGELDIELDGMGLGKDPELIARPKSIDFGLVTPGTVLDSVFYFIAQGPDTAIVSSIALSNFSGGIYFSAKPFDASLTFPLLLAPGDSLKMLAEFSGQEPLGTKSGEVQAQGDVSDSPYCFLTGSVGLPDILVTPAAIDYGVKYLGSTTDTNVVISNPSALPLQIDDIQPLTYGWSLIAPLAQLPATIAPGASLTLFLRFNPTDTGSFNYSLAIIAHSTASGGNYRSVLLRAKVVAVPLSLTSKFGLIYNCALDSVTEGGFTLTDSSQAPITISEILSSDSSIGLVDAQTFPLTLAPGEHFDFQFSHSPLSDTNSRVILKILNGDAVLRSDTFSVSTIHSTFTVTQQIASIDVNTLRTQGEVNIASDVTGFKLHSLIVDVASREPDAFFIDPASFVLNTQLIPGGAVTAVTPIAGGSTLTISVPQGINWSGAQASDNWLLRYNASAFVALAQSAKVLVSVVAPELAGCLEPATDSSTVTIPKNCGDKELRAQLGNLPLLTTAVVTPNPAMNSATLNMNLSADALLTVSMVDAGGHEYFQQRPLVGVRGAVQLPIDLSQLPSGAYVVRITLAGTKGLRETASLNLVKLR